MYKKRIGELLVESGYLSNEQLNHALNLRDTKYLTHRIGYVLTSLKLIEDDTLLEFLGKQRGTDAVNIQKIDISDDIIHLLPRKIAERYLVLPIKFISDGANKKLMLATTDPTNIEIMDSVSFITGYCIHSVYSREEDLKWAIQFYYYYPKRDVN